MNFFSITSILIIAILALPALSEGYITPGEFFIIWTILFVTILIMANTRWTILKLIERKIYDE